MSSRNIYETEISHDGLHRHRVIRGTDADIVQRKAVAQLDAWDEMWERRQEVERRRTEREVGLLLAEQKTSSAASQTEAAKGAISEIESILSKTLGVDDAVNWDELKDHVPFPDPKPTTPEKPMLHRKPLSTDMLYQPQVGFVDRLVPGRKKKASEAALDRFNNDLDQWRSRVQQIQASYELEIENHAASVAAWEADRQAFEESQRMGNESINVRRNDYVEKDPGAVTDYCDLVLSNSRYPDSFPQEFDVSYNPENRMLIVDYSLPAIENMPTLKEVRFVKSRDEFRESNLTQAVITRIYDRALYEITLRTIHELFEADTVSAIDSIVFNGWVSTVDKATGTGIKPCILTIHVKREDFDAIDLAGVEPKICFRNLKGIGSSKLHGLAPVAPIATIDRTDARFVSAYGVVEDLDESVNLAAMDWQDFEHLIRELFEEEFGSGGGEVKITRASRDEGVDAVAFDPYPIRGGKVVIQAKRYTKTVGVSAVRDLYGTVLNEGAMKGILVTTSDYGPDAYSFTSDKPFSLLNGANLLHLLEKHGYSARINIREAREGLLESTS